MKFCKPAECEDWLKERNRLRPETIPEIHVRRVLYPPEPHGFFSVSQWISHELTFRMPVLMWITEWGIWNSSENWHLYYKLRQSYGDYRLLPDAPGHLFLEHESEDFASFLQLSMLSGWGGYVLMHADYVNLFFSHDEYINFIAKDYDLSGILKGFDLRDVPTQLGEKAKH